MLFVLLFEVEKEVVAHCMLLVIQIRAAINKFGSVDVSKSRKEGNPFINTKKNRNENSKRR